MIRIDLHTHSLFSDGTHAPEELVRLAKECRIKVMSLTDHDTISGVPRFLQSCKRSGIQGISGVELSAEAPYTLHILGYAFDTTALSFEERLRTLRESRDERNGKILKALHQQGIFITMDDVASQTGGHVMARPHFARAMMLQGYVSSISEAFHRYLARGKPCYVSRERLSPRECIALIREAQGVAVLAHPFQTGLDEVDLETLLKALKDFGLWGIEALYGAHSGEERLFLSRLAQKFDLYSTGGSDFHGSNRQGRTLGVLFEEGTLPWARLGVTL